MLESREFLIAAAYLLSGAGLGGLALAIALDQRRLRQMLARFKVDERE